MKMTTTGGTATAVFERSDSPAARTLATRLSLSLKAELYGSSGQTCGPTVPLHAAGAFDRTFSEGETRACYAPWKNEMMFCGDLGDDLDSPLFERDRAIKRGGALRKRRGRILLTPERGVTP